MKHYVTKCSFNDGTFTRINVFVHHYILRLELDKQIDYDIIGFGQEIMRSSCPLRPGNFETMIGALNVVSSADLSDKEQEEIIAILTRQLQDHINKQAIKDIIE